MSTMKHGELLLSLIKEIALTSDLENQHATTAACYGIEHLLEILQDRR